MDFYIIDLNLIVRSKISCPEKLIWCVLCEYVRQRLVTTSNTGFGGFILSFFHYKQENYPTEKGGAGGWGRRRRGISYDQVKFING